MKFGTWIFENRRENSNMIKADKNNGRFTWRRSHFTKISEFLSGWEMFETKVVEKILTHFMFINYFPKIVPFMKMWGNQKFSELLKNYLKYLYKVKL